MPEHVERPIETDANAVGVVQGTSQGLELPIHSQWIDHHVVSTRREGSPGAADDHPLKGRGVAVHSDHGAAEKPAYGRDVVPPSIVIAGCEDFGARQPPQPFQVRLELTVVPGHREVARE